MTSPRITILIPTLNQGGAERSMVQLATGLHRAGCAVRLVTALRGDGVYRSEVPSEVPFLDLNAKRIRHLPMALYRYMSMDKPDILVTALMNNWVLGVASVMGYQGQIIISERTVFSQLLAEQRGILSRGRYFFSRRLYPKANGITAVSIGVAEDLFRLGLASKEKTRVIYNPVISDDFLAMANAEMSLPIMACDRPNFIAVGRLCEAKNYPLLLRAFLRVRRAIPCRLVILGEGELRLMIEAMIQELNLQGDVCLPGFVQNPFPYVTAASCFVLSSNREGLPGALIQSLACGTTAVSTDCLSGPAEILDGGKLGFLVPTGDEKTMAEAMLRALSSPFEKDVLKARAQLFSEKNCVRSYLELFSELSQR